MEEDTEGKYGTQEGREEFPSALDFKRVMRFLT